MCINTNYNKIDNYHRTILMITIMLIMVSVLFKIDKDSSIADKYEHTSLPTKDCSKTYLFGGFF